MLEVAIYRWQYYPLGYTWTIPSSLDHFVKANDVNDINWLDGRSLINY